MGNWCSFYCQQYLLLFQLGHLQVWVPGEGAETRAPLIYVLVHMFLSEIQLTQIPSCCFLSCEYLNPRENITHVLEVFILSHLSGKFCVL